jgi:multiple sugar transport system permease protein
MNEYLWPMIVARAPETQVLTVALGIFRQQTPQGGKDWPGLMAGNALAALPALALILFFGRKIVDSIQFTGLK